MEKGTIAKVLGGLGLGYFIANTNKGAKIIFTCMLLMSFARCSGLKSTFDGAVNNMSESAKIKTIEAKHDLEISNLAKKYKKQIDVIKLENIKTNKELVNKTRNDIVSKNKQIAEQKKIIAEQEKEIRKLNLMIRY